MNSIYRAVRQSAHSTQLKLRQQLSTTFSKSNNTSWIPPSLTQSLTQSINQSSIRIQQRIAPWKNYKSWTTQAQSLAAKHPLHQRINEVLARTKDVGGRSTWKAADQILSNATGSSPTPLSSIPPSVLESLTTVRTTVNNRIQSLSSSASNAIDSVKNSTTSTLKALPMSLSTATKESLEYGNNIVSSHAKSLYSALQKSTSSSIDSLQQSIAPQLQSLSSSFNTTSSTINPNAATQILKPHIKSASTSLSNSIPSKYAQSAKTRFQSVYTRGGERYRKLLRYWYITKVVVVTSVVGMCGYTLFNFVFKVITFFQ
ncbi:hypothetical protein BCR33DRAFT_710857 [Rhizoclosmatium globosum]|uniref:Uncharacterized protein n=1 Tax=Rhizoclosmatium globosum TaxID=329046 RepID=A0A1Y2D2A4_9FUNG|nr:hypothetical protein BCR33DRAFT_710857 [Rhizoclosmatium globosum]|eukprot:ORY53423.1 hypothetical protein BCR33DRAFT_710857 [Rhizoclosmatium globosum]